ncbi:glycosyltransferase family 9 protein, partial [Burkholderia sp. Ac-20379]|nr:glycosyltransferase family 9 protein [Burkholderia sp. Ac-20379]
QPCALPICRLRAGAPGRKLVGLFYDCAHRHRPELGSAARCWAARRSLPRDAVERLIADPALASRVLFVSLHHPTGEALAGGLPRGMRHYAPDIDGFDDTAACIRELDAVIAVDSSVANLAALLGAPTCVPVNHSGDWRWGSAGATSPWLPGVTVLRQRDSGDWRPVLDGLAAWLVQAVLGEEAGTAMA